MSSLWNLLSPIRSSIIKVEGSGRQLFGTVVQHGVNNKTVKVRVSAKHWNNKYKIYRFSHKTKMVHDEYNYCVSGDKVIIRNCQKLSANKAYFVKSIVKAFPRGDYNLKTKQEQDAAIKMANKKLEQSQEILQNKSEDKFENMKQSKGSASQKVL